MVLICFKKTSCTTLQSSDIITINLIYLLSCLRMQSVTSLLWRNSINKVWASMFFNPFMYILVIYTSESKLCGFLSIQIPSLLCCNWYARTQRATDSSSVSHHRKAREKHYNIQTAWFLSPALLRQFTQMVI